MSLLKSKIYGKIFNQYLFKKNQMSAYFLILIPQMGIEKKKIPFQNGAISFIVNISIKQHLVIVAMKTNCPDADQHKENVHFNNLVSNYFDCGPFVHDNFFLQYSNVYGNKSFVFRKKSIAKRNLFHSVTFVQQTI